MNAEDNPSKTESAKLALLDQGGIWMTYTLWRFDMLEQHDELLLDNETLEARVVRVIRIPRNDAGS